MTERAEKPAEALEYLDLEVFKGITLPVDGKVAILLENLYTVTRRFEVVLGF